MVGAEYGSGSSRDWAAKGPMLHGVKAVIAKSFERIHRSNFVGMGIIPLCFKAGEDAETLGLFYYFCRNHVVAIVEKEARWIILSSLLSSMPKEV